MKLKNADILEVFLNVLLVQLFHHWLYPVLLVKLFVQRNRLLPDVVQLIVCQRGNLAYFSTKGVGDQLGSELTTDYLDMLVVFVNVLNERSQFFDPGVVLRDQTISDNVLGHFAGDATQLSCVQLLSFMLILSSLNILTMHKIQNYFRVGTYFLFDSVLTSRQNDGFQVFQLFIGGSLILFSFVKLPVLVGI